MTTNRLHQSLIRFAIVLAGIHTAGAQAFSIKWFAVSGGGGASSGGIYSVTGAVGQPDAGKMNGGDFTVSGGFWAVISAIQTPGSPPLRLQLTSPTTAVIAWPAASPGFSLEQNSALGSANWTGVSESSAVVGDENQVTVILPPGNRFYRLVHR